MDYGWRRHVSAHRGVTDFFNKTEMDSHTLAQHKKYKEAVKKLERRRKEPDGLDVFQSEPEYGAIRDYLNLHELMSVGIKLNVFDDHVCFDFWSGELDRTHTSKNIAWILLDLARQGARKMDNLRLIVDPASDHPEVLENMKQLGLYTDCLGDGTWSKPTTAAEEPVVRGILLVAKALLGKRSICTKREIELWIRHVGPADDMPESKLKIFNFYQAMIDEGLATTAIEEVRAFLGLDQQA